METFVFLCGIIILIMVEGLLGWISIYSIKWWNYIVRGNVNPKKWYLFKKKVFGKDWAEDQVLFIGFSLIAIASWIMFCAVFNIFIYGNVDIETLPLTEFFKITNYLLIFIIPLTASPLLRWIIDVSRTLRIRKDDGVSDEIAELKAQIKKLQEKNYE